MANNVFISYSTKDQLKVRQIKQHLEEIGITCWMADDRVKSGEQFKTVIVKAIKESEIFLFVSSDSSNASDWTIKEINTAVHLKKPIIPVRLDTAPYNDSILFDIGALDFVDLSSIRKLKSGLNKLDKALQDMLKTEKEEKPERKRRKSPWKWVLVGAVVALLSAGMYMAISHGTPTVEKEELPNGDLVITIDTIHFKMVKIRGGAFMMGSNVRQSDQRHQHRVSLYDFYLAETEVTQELWQLVMKSNPSEHKGMANLPVDNVNWIDCKQFVSALNELTGMTFSLPTEAQWEYAARGGNGGTDSVYAGSEILEEVAHYRPGEDMYVVPVRTAGKPNRLGLYDMTGNVFEWCKDVYDTDGYPAESVSNPNGPSEKVEGKNDRVKRGGSWRCLVNDSSLFVTFRGSANETQKRIDYGLRLCINQ